MLSKRKVSFEEASATKTSKKRKTARPSQITNQTQNQIWTPAAPLSDRPSLDQSSLQKLLSMVQQWKDNPFAELEFRLGYLEKNNFNPSLPVQYVMNLHQSITDNDGSKDMWKVIHPKAEFRDFLLPNDIRVRQSLSTGKVYARCRRLRSIDLKCENRPYDVRCSIKEEIPIETEIPIKDVEKVKLNMRYSLEADIVSVDITKRSVGRNTEEACQNEVCRSIEIELMRDKVKPDMTNEDIVSHMMAFVRSTLAEYDLNGIRQKLYFRFHGEWLSDEE